jgi:hypothetical protein
MTATGKSFNALSAQKCQHCFHLLLRVRIRKTAEFLLGAICTDCLVRKVTSETMRHNLERKRERESDIRGKFILVDKVSTNKKEAYNSGT